MGVLTCMQPTRWAGRLMLVALPPSFRLFCALPGNHRLTFNEPWCSAVLGYGNGEHAPGRVSESAVEVYRAGHNMLLAHARAVDIYRTKFQPSQNGVIGITLNANWTGKTPRCIGCTRRCG